MRIEIYRPKKKKTNKQITIRRKYLYYKGIAKSVKKEKCRELWK